MKKHNIAWTHVLILYNKAFIIILQKISIATGSYLLCIKPDTVKLVASIRKTGAIQRSRNFLKVLISILI